MRVALIVPGFSADEHDWCIPALLNFVCALARRVELTVFALRYPYRRTSYRIGDATVHSFGYAGRRGWHSLALWREAARAIEQQHRAQPFDLLHAFWADEPAWIGASIASRLAIPLVVSLAGGELSSLPHIRYGVQQHPAPSLLMRWAHARADCITAGSMYLRDLAHAHGLRDVQLAPLGVDSELFTPNRDPKTQSSIVQLLNVGSLAPVKNQLMLVEAMRAVCDAMPHARLRIVGDGEMQAALQHAIARFDLSGHVELRSSIAHDQLPVVYHDADLFVQSSWHEAQGMAVLEAAACGVPIVGTAVGSVADLSPDCALAVPHDAPALAQAIIQLARDAERRTRLARAARAQVVECYSVDACVERFVQCYATATR